MRSYFAVFALGTICLTACSNTSSSPLAIAPETGYAPARQLQAAKNFSCAKSECIYVTNPVVTNSTGKSIGGSITIYPASANGNVAPVQVITGPNTGLTSPWGVAVDKDHNIYAANNNFGYRYTPSITVYKLGATANQAPFRDISGSNTQLCSPSGIAVSSEDDIYVDDALGTTSGLCYAVRVFGPTANLNVAPIRQIVGNNTLLSSPVAVSLYKNLVYVLNQGNVNPVALLSFGANGNGNIAPGTNVSGNKAFTFAYADGVAVSSANKTAYVVNHLNFVDQWGCPTYGGSGAGQILGFSVKANGNVAPTVNISGGNTGFVSPCSDAVDKEGRIYVTDTAANAIFVFAAGANGNVAPIQVIQGANTQLVAPEDIAVL